jgi:hypothetical protein
MAGNAFPNLVLWPTPPVSRLQPTRILTAFGESQILAQGWCRTPGTPVAHHLGQEAGDFTTAHGGSQNRWEHALRPAHNSDAGTSSFEALLQRYLPREVATTDTLGIHRLRHEKIRDRCIDRRLSFGYMSAAGEVAEGRFDRAQLGVGHMGHLDFTVGDREIQIG